jgi:hypothetical protein
LVNQKHYLSESFHDKLLKIDGNTIKPTRLYTILASQHVMTRLAPPPTTPTPTPPPQFDKNCGQAAAAIAERLSTTRRPANCLPVSHWATKEIANKYGLQMLTTLQDVARIGFDGFSGLRRPATASLPISIRRPW